MGEGLGDGGTPCRFSHMNRAAIRQNRFDKDATEGDIVCFRVIGQCACIITLVHKDTVRSFDGFHGSGGGLAEIGATSRCPCGTERGQEGVERGNHDVHVIVGERGAVVEAVNDLRHLIGREIKYQLKGGCR